MKKLFSGLVAGVLLFVSCNDKNISKENKNADVKIESEKSVKTNDVDSMLITAQKKSEVKMEKTSAATKNHVEEANVFGWYSDYVHFYKVLKVEHNDTFEKDSAKKRNVVLKDENGTDVFKSERTISYDENELDVFYLNNGKIKVLEYPSGVVTGKSVLELWNVENGMLDEIVILDKPFDVKNFSVSDDCGISFEYDLDWGKRFYYLPLVNEEEKDIPLAFVKKDVMDKKVAKDSIVRISAKYLTLENNKEVYLFKAKCNDEWISCENIILQTGTLDKIPEEKPDISLLRDDQSDVYSELRVTFKAYETAGALRDLKVTSEHGKKILMYSKPSEKSNVVSELVSDSIVGASGETDNGWVECLNYATNTHGYIRVENVLLK
ncbi:MAG TPA: hypothetical protein DCM57_00825 [Treponema sp.]|nr:hypothetical protein [Treponema sp.]